MATTAAVNNAFKRANLHRKRDGRALTLAGAIRPWPDRKGYDDSALHVINHLGLRKTPSFLPLWRAWNPSDTLHDPAGLRWYLVIGCGVEIAELSWFKQDMCEQLLPELDACLDLPASEWQRLGAEAIRSIEEQQCRDREHHRRQQVPVGFMPLVDALFKDDGRLYAGDLRISGLDSPTGLELWVGLHDIEGGLGAWDLSLPDERDRFWMVRETCFRCWQQGYLKLGDRRGIAWMFGLLRANPTLFESPELEEFRQRRRLSLPLQKVRLPGLPAAAR